MEVSPKLESARRRNRKRQLLPQMLDDLSRRLNRPAASFALLDLERTDEVRDALRRARQSSRASGDAAFRRTWPAGEVEEVRRALATLRERAPECRLYLFRALSDDCGAVETTSSEVLDNAFRLVGLDQEEVVAVNDDASYYLGLGYNTDHLKTGLVEVYDLLVWGEDWLSALRDA